jgi:hypothetical protein
MLADAVIGHDEVVSMFITLGTPRHLNDLRPAATSLVEIKRKVSIAVIDDEPFLRADALRHHDFQLRELGGDIRSVDQVATFPVVVCDIKGVGVKFGSKFEGAHVLAEIRKSFPDKYLIAFTGMTFDASYNEALASADKSITKDAGIDQWVQLLEDALRCVSDPRIRWTRFRQSLLARGVELFEVFKLEQAYIKGVQTKDQELLKSDSIIKDLAPEIKDLVIKFVIAGAGQLIEKAIS